jgi:hemerythrin-like domain-containing protein
MSVLNNLRKDHQRVLAQLKTAEKFVRHIEKKNKQLDLTKLNAIVDSFLAYFTSDLHAREEAVFSNLKAADPPAEKTQLFSELQAEHKACHELLKNISRQIQPPISEIDILQTRLVENIWTVIELRRRHIEKVQQRVYPCLEGYVPRANKRGKNLKILQETINSVYEI